MGVLIKQYNGNWQFSAKEVWTMNKQEFDKVYDWCVKHEVPFDAEYILNHVIKVKFNCIVFESPVFEDIFPTLKEFLTMKNTYVKQDEKYH